MKKVLIALLALAALAGGMFAQRWLSAVAVKEGAAELDAAFPDLQGKPHVLSEWKGKILVVNFWASWCPPCVEEMPEFFTLQSQLRDQGVQFVGILVDDEADAARAFLQSMPVNYPMLDGTLGGRQWAAKLGDTAEVLPFSAVYDAAGRRVHVEAGRFSREEVLRHINPLLGSAPAPGQ
jgi:thiol-disulfide isomerase/thioredoxin